MEALHDDMLMVVLSHIPNPWGIRARAVCKRWNTLLTSASFAKLMASRLYYHNDEEEEEEEDDDEGIMWLLLYTQKPSSPSHAHIVDPSSDIPPSSPLPAAHATELVHGQHPLLSESDRPIHEPKSVVAAPVLARGPLVFTADDNLDLKHLDRISATTATTATVVSQEQEDVGYRAGVAALQLGAFGYHPLSHLCMPVPLVLSGHRFHASISAGFTSPNHIHHIISDEVLVSSHMGLLVCRRIISSNSDAEEGGQAVEPSKCRGIIKELYFEGDPLQLRRPSFGSSSYDTANSRHHGTSSVVVPVPTRSRRRWVPVPAPPGLSWISRAGVAPLLVNKKRRGSGSEMGFQILVLGGHMEGGEEEGEKEENMALLYTSSRNGSGSGEWEAVPGPPAEMGRRPSQYAYYSPRLPRSRQSTLVWWKEAFCTLAGDAVYMFAPRTKVWAARVRLPCQPRIWDFRFLTIHALRGRLLLEGNFQEQGDFMRRYPLRIGVMELLAITPIPATLATSTATSSPQAAAMAGTTAAIQIPSSSSSDGGGGRGRRMYTYTYTYTWSHLGFMPDALSHGLSAQQPGYPAHSLYTAYSHPRSGRLCFAPSAAVEDVCCRFCKPAQHQSPAPNLVVFHAASASWNAKPLPPSNNHYVLSSPNFKGFTL